MERKLLWLRRVLFVKVLLTIFAWELPALLGPMSLLAFLKLSIPADPIYLRLAVAADVPIGYVTVDHNLIDGYRGYEDEVYGEDYVEGDPQFVDPAHEDFHLQPGSPAVDAGSAAGAPSVDMDGDPRPGGAGYDIGADEYDTGVTPGLSTLFLPLILR